MHVAVWNLICTLNFSIDWLPAMMSQNVLRREIIDTDKTVLIDSLLELLRLSKVRILSSRFR